MKPNPNTPRPTLEDEALNTLRSAQRRNDKDLADQAIAEFVRALGYGLIADEFLKVEQPKP